LLKQYTTISGDMWDLIAFKTLGSEMYTHALIESNLKYKDVVIFLRGRSPDDSRSGDPRRFGVAAVEKRRCE